MATKPASESKRREQYTKLQQKCLSTLSEFIAYRATLAEKYGPDWDRIGTKNAKESRRYAALDKARGKASAAMYTWLDTTGHDWRNGVPVVHVTTQLTYDEAVSGDRSNCPKAWGY